MKKGISAFIVAMLVLSTMGMMLANGPADAINVFDGPEPSGNVPVAPLSGGSFGGGNGTAGNPYMIEDVWDLQNMSGNLSAHYALANDIDASITSGWNSGLGFAPIGDNVHQFNGSFDGKNRTIAGLYINRPSTYSIGLFGVEDNGAVLKNVCLVNLDVTGFDYVGGLVGVHTPSPTISNSYVTGIVRGRYDVGGLVGRSYGTVSMCHSTATVVGTGYNIGGLIGDNINNGNVTECYATGNVTGDRQVGGLVGYHRNEGSTPIVANSYASGSVSGSSDVGGLIGSIWVGGTVSNSFWDTDTSGQATSAGGGGATGRTTAEMMTLTTFTGAGWTFGDTPGSGTWFMADGQTRPFLQMEYSTEIRNSHQLQMMGMDLSADYTLECDIDLLEITEPSQMWGTSLASGKGFSPIARDTDDGTFNYQGTMFSGSLEGNGFGIDSLFIRKTGNSFAGLFGSIEASGRVSNVTLTDVNVSAASWVGTLAGQNNGTVIKCGASGKVAGTATFGTGGLIGYLSGGSQTTECYADVTVTGLTYLGGLAGYSAGTAILNKSYATGDVTGTSSLVGGLIGYQNSGTISDCYAWGDVVGTSAVGGLIGGVSGNIVNSYSIGYPTGTSNVGGFRGERSIGTFTACFWDTTISGTTDGVGSDDPDPAGVFGSDTATMMTKATFTGAGWDFANIWCMAEGVTYPLFIWQDGAAPMADAGPDHIINEGGWVDLDGSGSWDDLAFSWKWTFFDGVTNVTEESMLFFAYQFTIPGVYVATLNITDPMGQWDTDTMTVTVLDITAPTADAGLDQTVDMGAVVTFDGSGSTDNIGVMNYTWTFIDGAAQTLYTDGPIYQFDHSGAFVVTLNVTDAAGNWDTDIMAVTVNDTEAPVADAGPDQTAGVGTAATFDGSGSTDNAGVVNYTWTFIDVTAVTLYGVGPSHTFAEPGIYPVTLNASDATGNWDTDAMNVTVNDVTDPVADAGPDQAVDQGAVVTFDGSGSTDNIGVVNYTWTFTDGTAKTLHSSAPTYTFGAPGIFTVTLTVRDVAGLTDTDTVQITVLDITAPVANAGADAIVLQGALVTFDGGGSTDNVGITNHTWNFTYNGSAIVLWGAGPAFQFDIPSIYTITLTVRDAVGLTDTDTMALTVKDTISPVVNAGPDQIVNEGALVTFDGSASTDNIGIVNWTWVFMYDGIGIALYGVSPTFVFETPSTYVVELKVTDAALNWATDTMAGRPGTVNITVLDITPPVASGGANVTIGQGVEVTLVGGYSSDNVGVVSYKWTFTYNGSLVTFNVVAPVFMFRIPGIYIATLNVSDAAGNWDTCTLMVTVIDTTLPVADAGTSQQVEVGALVTFDGSGSSDNVGVTNYTWAFTYDNHAVTLYGVAPSFTFDVIGSYWVTLTVSDAASNLDEGGVGVDVVDTEPPVANAGPDQTVDSGATVVFDGTASADNNTMGYYIWTFTYGGTLQHLDGASPSFVFVIPGDYTVTLTVSDGAGNTDADTVVIHVAATASTDSDGDGVPDVDDAFPDDPDESADSDGDGIGDNEDPDDDPKGSVGDYTWIILIVVVVVVVAALVGFKMMKGKKPESRPDEAKPEEKQPETEEIK